jgi:hypothetical protein
LPGEVNRIAQIYHTENTERFIISPCEPGFTYSKRGHINNYELNMHL